jgi:hypothetical protein
VWSKWDGLGHFAIVRWTFRIGIGKTKKICSWTKWIRAIHAWTMPSAWLNGAWPRADGAALKDRSLLRLCANSGPTNRLPVVWRNLKHTNGICQDKQLGAYLMLPLSHLWPELGCGNYKWLSQFPNFLDYGQSTLQWSRMKPDKVVCLPSRCAVSKNEWKTIFVSSGERLSTSNCSPSTHLLLWYWRNAQVCAISSFWNWLRVCVPYFLLCVTAASVPLRKIQWFIR